MLIRPCPLPRLFLHFFDVHFLDRAARLRNPQRIEQEAELALRLAVLAAGEVFVPAASYFESPMCARILNRHEQLFTSGAVQLVGGTGNISDFARTKLRRYDPGGAQYRTYEALVDGDRTIDLAFHPRRRSATQDLKEAWASSAQRDGGPAAVFGNHPVQLPLGFEQTWDEIPERLGHRAFTPEYVVPELLGPSADQLAAGRVADLINAQYFASFADELGAGLVTDLNLLSSAWLPPTSGAHLAFRATREELRRTGTLTRVVAADPSALMTLREDRHVVTALLETLPRAVSRWGSGAHLAAQLTLPTTVELAPLLETMRSIRSGKATANRYHRAAATLLSALFAGSFGTQGLEEPIDQGRKRIDIVWPNMAHGGFFWWLGQHWDASTIVCEVKNYQDDLANPEVDQLAGRFSRRLARAGLLVCRHLKNKELFLDRCRDSAIAGRGLVIPLDHDDLEHLIAAGTDPADSAPLSRWLHTRTTRILN